MSNYENHPGFDAQDCARRITVTALTKSTANGYACGNTGGHCLPSEDCGHCVEEEAPKPQQCGCGRGYASAFDGICKFCRESLVSRAVAKKFGVRHRGDGMDLDQYQAATKPWSPKNVRSQS